MRCLKCCAVFCALLLFLCSLPTVSAADDGSTWIELLESTSITNFGENWFSFTGNKAQFTIPLHTERRLCQIDMLIWHQTAERIQGASVTLGGSSTTLTAVYLGSNISRVYGAIPNGFYEEINVSVTKTTTSSATFELLSCKVSPISAVSFDCSAQLYIQDEKLYLDAPCEHEYDGIDNPEYTLGTQYAVVVADWQKYDSITITGSMDRMSLNSVRANLGTQGLPYEITYTSSNATGSSSTYYLWQDVKHYTYDDSYQGSIEGDVFTQTEYHCKTLYNLTIDLSGVDRKQTTNLLVWFTGAYTTTSGYRLQIVGVTGSVELPDTSQSVWWQRFTSFMSGLFSADPEDESAAEDFKEDAEQQRDELDDMNGQLDEVSKPDVGGIQMDVNNYIDAGSSQSLSSALVSLTSNNLIISMMCITLTIALVGYVLYGKR